MTILERIDQERFRAFASLDTASRAAFGQYSTPLAVAKRLARLVATESKHLRILDPGAGNGILSACLVAELLNRVQTPKQISLTLVERDLDLAESLGTTLRACADLCANSKVGFEARVVRSDFVTWSEQHIGEFGLAGLDGFDVCIMNPPYKKIPSASNTRAALDRMGYPASNAYSAFMLLAMALLRQGGELVAIIPRSFTNGAYFRSFREQFFSRMALSDVISFESRDTVFSGDSVLQENVIIRAAKSPIATSSDSVAVSVRNIVAEDCEFEKHFAKVLRAGQLMPLGASGPLLIPTSNSAAQALEQTDFCRGRFRAMQLQVSTGRTVAYRSKRRHRVTAEGDALPFCHGANIVDGRFQWPIESAKYPQWISIESEGQPLETFPQGNYVLVRRISAKEDPQRIQAALVRAEDLPPAGFCAENKVNVIHRAGRGLSRSHAKQVCAWLQSSEADTLARMLCGSTQINAGDLRCLLNGRQS